MDPSDFLPNNYEGPVHPNHDILTVVIIVAVIALIASIVQAIKAKGLRRGLGEHPALLLPAGLLLWPLIRDKKPADAPGTTNLHAYCGICKRGYKAVITSTTTAVRCRCGAINTIRR